jgi:lysophospholipase L1-like esterase
MAQRITLPQLIEKIQNQKLSKEEARKYFLAERNPLQPFDFKTYINPEFVDVRNFEALARDADQLVTSIAPEPLTRKKAVSKRRAISHKIVAEGDSWFRLPQIWPFPKTCIDFLQLSGYPMPNLAHWGDTLDEILFLGEFWPFIDAGCDLLLFSAGGNDVLGGGQLAEFLNLFDVGHTKPSDASYYVKPNFFQNLNRIVSRLEAGLILPMVGRRANKKIIMHGYDYVIPQPNGPWLGGPMEYQGLDPTFNAALCRAIIRLMIDAYNAKLKALASKYSHAFVHLDLRGTVGPREWYDELHAKEVAAKKIARKFAAKIDSVTVSPQERAISKLYATPSAVA